MLSPCCVSVRIQMVVVAPVIISSSTNQIHVTHTEQKRERENKVARKRERDRRELRYRGENMEQSRGEGGRRYSRPLFPKHVI